MAGVQVSWEIVNSLTLAFSITRAASDVMLGKVAIIAFTRLVRTAVPLELRIQLPTGLLKKWASHWAWSLPPRYALYCSVRFFKFRLSILLKLPMSSSFFLVAEIGYHYLKSYIEV